LPNKEVFIKPFDSSKRGPRILSKGKKHIGRKVIPVPCRGRSPTPNERSWSI